MTDKTYRTPGPVYLPQTEDTEKLNILENQRFGILKDIAREYQNLWKKKTGKDIDFWNEAIPQVLFDTLESVMGGDKAAKAYVKFIEEKHEKNK